MKTHEVMAEYPINRNELHKLADEGKITKQMVNYGKIPAYSRADIERELKENLELKERALGQNTDRAQSGQDLEEG
jgi:hypothetical protein